MHPVLAPRASGRVRRLRVVVVSARERRTDDRALDVGVDHLVRLRRAVDVAVRDVLGVPEGRPVDPSVPSASDACALIWRAYWRARVDHPTVVVEVVAAARTREASVVLDDRHDRLGWLRDLGALRGVELAWGNALAADPACPVLDVVGGVLRDGRSHEGVDRVAAQALGGVVGRPVAAHTADVRVEHAGGDGRLALGLALARHVGDIGPVGSNPAVVAVLVGVAVVQEIWVVRAVDVDRERHLAPLAAAAQALRPVAGEGIVVVGGVGRLRIRDGALLAQVLGDAGKGHHLLCAEHHDGHEQRDDADDHQQLGDRECPVVGLRSVHLIEDISALAANECPSGTIPHHGSSLQMRRGCARLRWFGDDFRRLRQG